MRDFPEHSTKHLKTSLLEHREQLKQKYIIFTVHTHKIQIRLSFLSYLFNIPTGRPCPLHNRWIIWPRPISIIWAPAYRKKGAESYQTAHDPKTFLKRWWALTCGWQHLSLSLQGGIVQKSWSEDDEEENLHPERHNSPATPLRDIHTGVLCSLRWESWNDMSRSDMVYSNYFQILYHFHYTYSFYANKPIYRPFW